MTPPKSFSFATTVRDADPIPRGHEVLGMRIVPGVTFIDLVYRALAAEGVDLPDVELRNIFFAEPLVTTDAADVEVTIAFDSATRMASVYGRPLAAERSEASRVEHFRCECHFGESIAPAAPDLSAIDARTAQPVELETLYAAARQAGIHHSGFMKGSGSVRTAARGALVEMELSAEAAAYAAHFLLHPAHLDSSTVAAFIAPSRAGFELRPYIPLHLKSFRAFAPLPRQVLVHVARSASDAPPADVIAVDYQILAVDGRVLADIHGLTVKHVRSEASIRRVTAGNDPRPAGVERTLMAATPAPAPAVRAEATGSKSAAAFESLVRELVAAIVNVSPASIDLDRGFYDQQLDSAHLLQITQALEAKLGTPLYPTVMFEYPTVRELAAYLASQTDTRIVDPVTIYEECWQIDEAAAHASSAFADALLLFASNEAQGRLLAEELRQPGEGASIVTVYAGEGFRRVGPHEYEVAPDRLEDYSQVLASIGHVPRAVVLAWSPAAESAPLRDRIARSMYAALGVTQALSASRLAQHVDVLAVWPRRGAASAAAEAALRGFARTVRQEQPSLRWRTVEVDDAAPSALAEAVSRELATASDAVDVQYVAGRRHVRRWTPLAAAGAAAGATTSASAGAAADAGVAPGAGPRHDGVYLVTGGAGALSLHCARHLVAGGGRVVLLGRRPWTSVAAAVAALGAGDAVTYVAGDVQRTEDVQQAVAIARARYGGLTGVLHAAGMTRDGLARHKPAADVAAVLASKVEGTVALDEATRDEALAWFVLFASTSGVLGNVGQSDYAYANAFQWAYAAKREALRARGARQGRTLTIAWPFWADGGMRVDADRWQHLSATFGMVPLETDCGMRTLDRLLTSDRSAVLVMAGDERRMAPLLASGAGHAQAPRPPAVSGPPAAVALSNPPVESNATLRGRDDIAIVGVSGRYPMAGSLDEFWANLRGGRDCITEVPRERWDHAPYYADARDSGRTNSKWGGFLRGADLFAPLFFNIAPREAELIDPQERLFLEIVWELLEDAGYTRRALGGSQVGVFVGAMWAQYQMLRGTERDPDARASSIFASIANRVSYYFDFQGPSLAVDTMCSSSLTTVHLACESIARGECDVAIAGGVNLTLHPDKYLQLAQGGFTSSDGRCRSFGAGGDGYVPGEGVGALLLKPLSKALADGDHVYAIVRATAISHSGRSSGYTVPNPAAQAALIQRTLAKAGVHPRTISYVEAHGTGTSLGDPIEIAALNKAFRHGTADTGFCAIGSVKSNIGHLESAAGIAGLTKVLLQLRFRRLVPSLHADTLNPAIDFGTTPFHVQRSLGRWERPCVVENGAAVVYPRRAGISGFGAGGANAHVIVEEYEAAPQPAVSGEQVFVLSARTARGLEEYAGRFVAWLEQPPDDDGELPALASIAFTMQTGREAMEHRLAFVARSSAELASKLRAFLGGHGDAAGIYRGTSGAPSSALRAIFADADVHSLVAGIVDRKGLPTLAALWVEGVEIDWRKLHPSPFPRRTPLPTYPFERQRLWMRGIASPVASASTSTSEEQTAAIPPAPAVRSESAARAEAAARTEGGAARKLVLRSVAAPASDQRAAAPAAAANVPVPVPRVALATVPVADTRALPESAAVPSLNLRDIVRQAVADVLYVAPSEVDDDKPFVDLGMDSVLGVELVNTLNARFNTTVRASDLYDSPSVATLAAKFSELGAAPPSAPAVAPSIVHAAAPEPPQHAEEESVAVEDAIAIVGVSGRFPGAATVEDLWRNVRSGICSVTEVPADRWNPAEYFDRDRNAPGKTYCKWGGFLSDVDKFDPLFFGISPLEAEALDPQQRLFLEEAWHALEDAGFGAEALDRLKCGVFAGVMSGSEYPPHIFNSSSMLAARIAYVLNLRGPAAALDTACSSSLVALHMACQSLRSRETDVMLAGGVSLYLTVMPFIGLSKAGMLSASGSCQTFDAQADGFVPAEAAVVVVLRRLEDALANGDRIYGVIRGSGVNQDGRTNGITAPSMKRQRDLCVEVYRQSGVHPATISYVEAHGTGTRLGDPIEVRALTEAFQQFTDARQFCGIGSVKANLGHTSAAAGLAGLVKVLMAMDHAEIPPAVNLETVNPEIDFQNSPFYCPRVVSPWASTAGKPRRAAISSFGYSGTNAHVIVEEPPRAAPLEKPEPAWMLVPFSAKTREALDERIRATRDWLRDHATSCALPDLSYTLLARRSHFAIRSMVVARDVDDLLRRLDRIVETRSAEDYFVSANGTKPADPALSALGGRLLTDFRATATDLHAGREHAAGLAALYVAGCDLDWSVLFAGQRRRVVSLPGYPFARERHWRWQPESVSEAVPASGQPAHALVGEEVPAQASEHDALEFLEGVFASVLKLDRTKIDPTAGFDAYGIDSIIVGSIVQALERQYGKLSPTLLFKYKNLNDLAAYLSTQPIRSMGESGAAAAPDAAQRPRPGTARGAQAKGVDVEPAPAPEDRDVAIIGISGRFPQARDLDELWFNLRAGRDCITPIPASRWDHAQYFDPEKGRFGSSYSNWGGFLDDVDRFDPLFFNISPLEARFMDPQERLFLETAWACFEDAAYPPSRLADGAAGDRRAAVGVFVGVTFNDYHLWGLGEWQRGNPIPLGTQSFSIANRVSYALNLRGPSLTVDTACSSSLMALHLAVASLRRGECEMALAGGVNLTLHPSKYITLAANRMHSSDGRCRSFGAGGDGFVSGEGVCTVLLKRRADAERDGDRIYAVIKGTATNHDGHTHGYTVPNPVAQAEVIRAALEDARVSARSISYVEAHGTGTALGDPIEIAGLTDAYRVDTGDAQYCAIGSVKSNVGHLEAAAGIAQLAKVVLQLRHETLVPSLHAEQTNPDIDFAATPFYVQRTLESWRRPAAVVDGVRIEEPRRAGISSFGAGGVNVHVVVEEAPRQGFLRGEPLPLPEIVAEVRRHAEAGEEAGEDAGAGREAFERLQAWARRLLLRTLRGLGLFLTPHEAVVRTELEDTLSLAPSYRRFFSVVLDILERGGFVRRDGLYVIGDDVLGSRALREELAALDDIKAELLREYPVLADHARLLEVCICEYDRILSGNVSATSVMFPNASMALVDGVYRANSRIDTCVGEMVAACVARAPHRLKILEAGAGTGGTSEYVLAALAGQSNFQYVYTDVSPAFLAFGEERFGHTPGIEFRLLDVERDPREQDLEPETFDIVIAANVLHATKRIDQTLEHVRRLLAPGGLLLIKEVVVQAEFAALTFGLLDGWWRFEDDDSRLPDSPLLDVPLWNLALARNGFSEVSLLAPHDSAEQVLAARNGAPEHESAVAMPCIIPLSAKSEESLRRSAERLIRYLDRSTRGDAGSTPPRLIDVAYTLQTGREAMPYRLALVAVSADDLVARLTRYLEDSTDAEAALRIYAGRTSASDAPPLEGMPADLAALEHYAREWVNGRLVRWDSLYAGQRPRRVSLPTYPFGGQRYWIAADTAVASDAASVAARSAGTAPVDADPVMPDMRAALAATPLSEREDRLRAYLQDRLGEVLGFISPAAPDPEQGFFDMGMDSVAAIRFSQIIEATLGVALTETTVFNYPNLTELAKYMMAELYPPNAGVAEAPNAGVADAPAAEASMLDALEAALRAEMAEAERVLAGSGAAGGVAIATDAR